ncbi:prepilin-type N-terminal cleavage/methylation domain-containing protein [Ruegeria sp. SCPT10]|uniref:prepilin-type N-terminal cleavage/methylation domain-containing protein n=1 Tax=Ruegeria sp. SCP10 TaxID=3141377 RepID=UPI003337454C
MNARSGLSLLELLIALALLALIATGLSGALSFAVSVYDRARPDTFQSDQIALKTRLRSWLSNASSPSEVTPYPVSFVGTTEQLEFTTTQTKGFASEAAALRVLVENAFGDLVVTVSEMDDEGNVFSVHAGIVAVYVDPVFSYYDHRASELVWDEDWSDPARLPDLVRIVAKNGNDQKWSTFVVKLILN